MTAHRVLMYSGGMDSYCLRTIWQPDTLVYVDMGTPYSQVEMSRLDPLVRIVSMPALGNWERPNAIIPLRNLFLVAVGAQWGAEEGPDAGGGVEVALAATAGDRSLDKTPPFADMSGDLMSYCWSEQWWTPGKDIRVVLPAKNMSKGVLVRDYVEAGGGVEALVRESWSCYTPRESGEPCGTCKPCVRRWVALASNGIESTPDCRAEALRWRRDGEVRDVEEDDWEMALDFSKGWSQ